MANEQVCGRCDHTVSEDDRYCAQCGRSLISPGIRLADSVRRFHESLSPSHLGLLGLTGLAVIGVASENLIVYKLSFPVSLALLALSIGCAGAYLGWHWGAMTVERIRLSWMVQVFVGAMVLLGGVWLVDQALLALVGEGGFRIPGVQMQVAAGSPRTMIISGPPPYWLGVMVLGLVATAIGNLAHILKGRRRGELVNDCTGRE